MKPRLLTPRVVRPSPVDLVRAITPPPTALPQRSPRLPGTEYDEQRDPVTERLHRPRVEFVEPSRLGPGAGDCRVCWCPRDFHLQGYGEREGRCWRPGCDSDCGGFKKVRQWPRRLWRAACVLYWSFALVGLATLTWLAVAAS